MDLQKLLQWLQWKMASQQQVDAARQREAQSLNSFAPRAPDGNIQQQGLGGIFSDALPMTPRDMFNYKYPGLANILKQEEQPSPPMQQRPYRGYL